MHEIKRRFRQRIPNDVVAAHLQIREVERFKKAGIDVSRQYASCGADAISEPTRDGSAPTAHFQAVPAASDTALLQVTDGAGVEQSGEDGEPCGRLSSAIIEQVA